MRSLYIRKLLGLKGTRTEHIAKVIDGDTILTREGNKYRIYGIYALEKSQEFGDRCTAFLRQLTKETGGRVEIEETGTSTYDRKVAILYGQTCIDIGRVMVRAGFALDAPKYSKGKYADDEQYARAKGKGMHKKKRENPEAFRRRMKRA